MTGNGSQQSARRQERWERDNRSLGGGRISGVVKSRPVTGFHLRDEYPELVLRPIVEQFGGLWREDQPVVIDKNLISSRHPDDMPHFTSAIREWLISRTNDERKGLRQEDRGDR
jgi:putative intracellular protease/amidase